MRRRTVTRTAVDGGVADHGASRGSASGRGSAGERSREQEPPGRPAEAVDPIEQVKQLNELREQGILTEGEFTQEKRKLLDLQ